MAVESGKNQDAQSLASAWQEYCIDAMQRWTLLVDVFRQRGNNYLEIKAREAPHVLSFQAELILDGRRFPRPVNYALVRILPPNGVRLDVGKRPFIVFDPRAGHGPGIGGMKHDSEIGMAMAAGHPCYFVGFLPEPMPGQTVEDVCHAEAKFVEEVIARHPEAEGKPCLIGNCQAGWQIMLMAALHPELTGPIMLAGSPLSYWSGVRGKNPMRYLGGLLGGSWMTAMAGDLGAGIFDGANLVANFESLHPANTLWKKPYDVYSKVDTEAPRFLEFEKWWGSPVLLNAVEMQSIADDLFIGNKLSCGELRNAQGTVVDLRNIRSPIIVFCSQGDDITPPPQALHWILDLYEHESEIVAAGQTIVYCLHQSIGHLGIFVSGKVATKEHGEFAQCMDMIDLMPPGLYEAVISGVDESTENPELAGNYLFTLEARRLADIQALGENSPEEDRCFAAAARVSEINHGLYRTCLAPFVRYMSTPQSAELQRHLHPNRLRFEMFADSNPFMKPVRTAAEAVRAARRPAAADNPWLLAEHAMSDSIIAGLEGWTRLRDQLEEAVFFNVYGSPLLQAMIGLGAEDSVGVRRIGRDLSREAAAQKLAAELGRQVDKGGLMEAFLRALIYIRRPERKVDERGFAALKEISAALPPEKRIGMARFKEILKEQFLILEQDEERAMEALPRLLPDEQEERNAALGAIQRVLSARGSLSDDARRRLERVESIFTGPVPDRAAADRQREELPVGE